MSVGRGAFTHCLKPWHAGSVEGMHAAPQTGQAPQPPANDVRLHLDAVSQRQPSRIRADWLVEDLERVLSRLLPSARVEPAPRFAALEALALWLRARRSGLGGGAEGVLSSARLRLLLEALRGLPQHAAALAQMVFAICNERSALRLFAECGLPAEQGLIGATTDRLLDKCLPTVVDDGDLAQLVARLFPRAADADWLEEMGPELATELSRAVGFAGSAAPIREAMLDALMLLAARASATGLAADIRERAPQVDLPNDPFLRLPRACDAFAAAASDGRIASAAPAFRAALTHCRWALRGVRERLEESGISAGLVFRLERATRTLDRMSALVAVLAPDPPQSGTAATLQLLAGLVRDRIEDASVRSVFHSSVRLLARKAIERAGRTGEHYITTTRGAWHRMVSSAAGGGVLTAGTVVVKLAIHGASLPIFFEGLASSANYAASFLLMQAFAFTLATKQPAMTAAALAAAMCPKGAGDGERQPLDVQRLVDLVARITRSQLAAVLGNLGMVIPSAILLDAAWRLLTGHAFLDAESARHVAESLHPTRSGTIAFASLTGLLLWLGSLGAGWLENFVVFRRLPEAIAASPRLRRLCGTQRTQRWARGLARHAAGIGGSIALGVLLGMTPSIGRFFGVPLEVRHVTLQTGALALAAASAGFAHALDGPMPGAIAGIGVIALFNFGVSFSLALFVALKGREATGRDHRAFVHALLLRLWCSPGSFFLPPSR